MIVLLVSCVAGLIWRDRNHGRLDSWLAPQTIASLVGLIVGFVLLSWQLDRQHENAKRVNREQSQDRLKADLYNKIAERIEATSVPLVEVGGLPVAFMGELIVRLSASSELASVPKSSYFAEIPTKHQAASRSITALMSVLETHAIVMPEFAVFRKRLAKGLSALSVAINDFSQAAFQFAGSQLRGPIRWPPTEAERNQLDVLAASAQWASISLAGVVWDLRVEAQNYLLGGLFPEHRVPPRMPADTSVQVTTLPSHVSPD